MPPLIGVNPDSLYEWQKVHPEFSLAVRAGQRGRHDVLGEPTSGCGTWRAWQRPGHPVGVKEPIARCEWLAP